MTSTVDNVIDEGNACTILPATLVQLHKLGFKLVPLSLEHHVVMSWTPIYEDSNFWSPEKIVTESPKFKNVATVFGKSQVKDEKGLELQLNCFEIDSENVYVILSSEKIQDPILEMKIQNLISKTGSKTLLDFLKQTTVVVKTKRQCGYHIYWFSREQNPRIRVVDCKAGYEFEIKTDKGSGHCTLPTSTHRNDLEFRYSHVGKQDKIAIIDELYDILSVILSGCLIKKNNYDFNQDRYNSRGKVNNSYQHNDVILKQDQIADSVSELIKYYQQGYRDAFTLQFSGFAFKQNIAEESAACIAKELCKKTNDLETESRLHVDRRTYFNGANGSDISGSSGLKEVIATLHPHGEEEQANKIVKSVIDIWQRYEVPIHTLNLSKVASLTDEQLDKIKIESEDIEYCINTILKEAPNEQIPVRQLFVGLCSSATHLPQNIAIETQSGAGKNYIIHKVISKFPQRDIIILSGMTPKALFHDQGIKAVKNLETGEYENLDEMVDSIDTKIEDKEEEIEKAKEKQRMEELRKEIKCLQRQKEFLYSKAVKLIDLDGKVLVLLDTPDHNLLANIAPILSHDRYEQEYKFVEANSGPMRTKVNIIRGFPTLFYTQASDHSHKRRFIEISRRRISISVDSSEKKVTDAVALKVERAGGARGEYDLKVVDKATIYKVKLILAILMRKLRKLSRPYKEQSTRDKTLKLDEVEAGTFVPFKQTLKIGLPHKHVLDMTATEIFNTYLTLLSKINADSRPKLVYSDGIVMPIATFEDLAVAMSLLHKGNNPGLSPELQQWYEEVFLEVYNNKVKKLREREKQRQSSRRK